MTEVHEKLLKKFIHAFNLVFFAFMSQISQNINHKPFEAETQSQIFINIYEFHTQSTFMNFTHILNHSLTLINTHTHTENQLWLYLPFSSLS